MVKLLSTGGARINVVAENISCLFYMSTQQVAADCVPLHGRILTEVALVQLLTRLAKPMYA